MPELPEVEAAARELRSRLVGKRIERVVVNHPALRRTLDSRDARSLRGRSVVAVERVGKHQLIRLDDARAIHAHFRMTGDWVFARRGESDPPYARLVIHLDDDSRLILSDPRALASVRVGEASLPDLGPSADDPSLDGGAPRRAIARRSAPIKPVLMDQRVIAGLGNIYAAEALWHARVDPRTPANRIGPRRANAVVAGIRTALSRAARNPARYAGTRSPRFEVYDREGEPCRRCARKIRRITQAGRSTYFCPGCQR